MPDLLKEFLIKTDEGLAKLDKNLLELEENPNKAVVWADVFDFFNFVRSVSLFVGFDRCYALSVAAIDDIKEYQNGEDGKETFPKILIKYQRVKKIVSSSLLLGREPREDDTDILPIVEISIKQENASSLKMLHVAKLLAKKEKTITSQEADLDYREEKVIAWEKGLRAKEANLTVWENKLSLGEKKILSAEDSVALAFEKIKQAQERNVREENITRQQKEYYQTLIKKEVDSRKTIYDEKNKQIEQKFNEQTRLLEKLKDQMHTMCLPLDYLMLQKNTADLVRSKMELQNHFQKSNERADILSLEKITDVIWFLHELIIQARSYSFLEVKNVIDTFVVEKSKKYGRQVSCKIDASDFISMDIDAKEALIQIFSILIDNAFAHTHLVDEKSVLELNVKIIQNGSFLNIEVQDNGLNTNDFRQKIEDDKFLDLEYAHQLSDLELLQYLLHPEILRHTETRGLLLVCRILEKTGGNIRLSYLNGFLVSFKLPRSFLFSDLLIFGNADQRYALPMSMVVETFSFGMYPITVHNGSRFMEWQGGLLPIMDQKNAFGKKTFENYGLVLHAGAHIFVLPVENVFNAEKTIEDSFEGVSTDTNVIKMVLTMESALKVSVLDMSFLLRLQSLLLASPDCVCEEMVDTEKTFASYMIFKSDPNVMGAILIDKIEKIEAFSGYKTDLVSSEPIVFSVGKRLALKDTSIKKNFAYAQAVLVLKNKALAVQEVIDIIEVPFDKDANDINFISYRNKKVQILKD